MKKALSVGINYVGSEYELRGCINDSNNIVVFLQSQGFDNIKTVLEQEATTDGIKAALEWLVADLKSGDIIVFHYSGHGSQLPSASEADGFEEIICPVDLDWKKKVITDDTLREIFSKVPDGVSTTVILDCCHSGNMLDHKNSLSIERHANTISVVDANLKSRFLPPPARIEKKLADRTLVNWSTSKDINRNALLIAGCKSDQTSADALIDGIYQGAATASMLKLVKYNPSISYRSLVTEMNDFMHYNGFTQEPVLDGESDLYDNLLMSPFPVLQETSAEEKIEQVETAKDKTILLLTGFLLLLIVTIFVVM